MTDQPVPTILSGEFHVAAKGTFQSRCFPYTAAGLNYNHADAEPRDVAFKKAKALWRKVKKANPDLEIRLMDFQTTEFFL